MSYDVYFTMDTGGKEPAPFGDTLNHTYNCGSMFRAAIPGGIQALAGKLGEEVVLVLQSGIADMVYRPQIYAAMNPENGWGNTETAQEFLVQIEADWA